MCRLLAVTASVPIDATPILDAFAHACRDSKEYQGHGWGVARRVVADVVRGAGGRPATNGGPAVPAGGGMDAWARHRSVQPIWEDARPALAPARIWVAHARSAFRNEGIVVENNMPFLADDLAFAFNGELRGVRLNAQGETGAARLLHLLERFRDASGGDVLDALVRLDSVVTKRTAYVRALNLVVADLDRVYVHSHWSEDPGYFTLHTAVVEDPEALGVVPGGDGASAEATRAAAEPTRATARTPVALPAIAATSPPAIAIVCSERLALPGIGSWAPVADRTTMTLECGAPCWS